MDCSRASEADRVRECSEGVQWPNDKKPIRFMIGQTHPRSLLFLVKSNNRSETSGVVCLRALYVPGVPRELSAASAAASFAPVDRHLGAGGRPEAELRSAPAGRQAMLCASYAAAPFVRSRCNDDLVVDGAGRLLGGRPRGRL